MQIFKFQTLQNRFSRPTSPTKNLPPSFDLLPSKKHWGQQASGVHHIHRGGSNIFKEKALQRPRHAILRNRKHIRLSPKLLIISTISTLDYPQTIWAYLNSSPGPSNTLKCIRIKTTRKTSGVHDNGVSHNCRFCCESSTCSEGDDWGVGVETSYCYVGLGWSEDIDGCCSGGRFGEGEAGEG